MTGTGHKIGTADKNWTHEPQYLSFLSLKQEEGNKRMGGGGENWET
jgi:hypothetical protein